MDEHQPALQRLLAVEGVEGSGLVEWVLIVALAILILLPVILAIVDLAGQRLDAYYQGM